MKLLAGKRNIHHERIHLDWPKFTICHKQTISHNYCQLSFVCVSFRFQLLNTQNGHLEQSLVVVGFEPTQPHYLTVNPLLLCVSGELTFGFLSMKSHCTSWKDKCDKLECGWKRSCPDSQVKDWLFTVNISDGRAFKALRLTLNVSYHVRWLNTNFHIWLCVSGRKCYYYVTVRLFMYYSHTFPPSCHQGRPGDNRCFVGFLSEKVSSRVQRDNDLPSPFCSALCVCLYLIVWSLYWPVYSN